jgi:hypothetical protein
MIHDRTTSIPPLPLVNCVPIKEFAGWNVGDGGRETGLTSGYSSQGPARNTLFSLLSLYWPAVPGW